MAKKTKRAAGQRTGAPATPRQQPSATPGSPAGKPGASAGKTGSAAGQAHPPRAERRVEMVQKRRDARIQLAERERRRKMLVRVASALVIVALLAAIGYRVYNQVQSNALAKDVTTYGGDNANRNHVEGAVQYEVIPPVGGDHNQYWQNCGYYDKPIYNWHGVHSLEHGAVWITYRPDLPQAQIDTLKDIAKESYIVVSPYPGIDAPVIATVWDHQIKLKGADDARLKEFIKQYRLNPKYTPELGALCTMGVSTTMTSGEPQQKPRLAGTPEIEGTTEPIQGASTMPAATVTPTANPTASPAANAADQPRRSGG